MDVTGNERWLVECGGQRQYGAYVVVDASVVHHS